MTILFATYVTNNDWKIECAEPLMRSFKYFHPDIPFKIFEGSDVNGAFDKNDPTRNIRLLKPTLGKKVMGQYDRVVLLDADQLIVGPLTELLEEDWEVAGVRSNDDTGRSHPLGAFCTPKIPWQEYLNCGLCGIGNPQVWNDWDHLNRTHNPHMGDAEQGTWNEVFHSNKYKKKLLDPVEGNLIYGTAANSAHWGSLQMDGDKVTLNLTGTSKWVKILHKAGCGAIGPSNGKFSFGFDGEVAKHIERVKS